MAKVKIAFYCTKEKKSYAIGQEYTGKRKDIGSMLVPKKQTKKK